MNFVVGYYAGRDSANQESGYEINKLKRENSRLKEQLSEANKLIKWVVRTGWSGNQEEDDFDRYIDKWNVK